jgi:hypothetical protein
MKAKVSSLYRNGKRLPINKVASTVTGDLNLSVSKHPVTGLCCHEAVVLEESGRSLLPDIHDVECVCIAAHGLRLRGIEIHAGKETAQEWWCIPL